MSSAMPMAVVQGIVFACPFAHCPSGPPAMALVPGVAGG